MDIFKELKEAAGATFSLSVHTLLAYCGLTILVYFVVQSVYRLTLHPLAKYPGPLSYKLSNWPLIFQCAGGNRHIHHLLDHEKYGPIVRIGPNILSFNTEPALNTIYGPQKSNVRKSEWYTTVDAGSGALSIASETDKQKHAIRRRFIAQCFSTNALKSAEPFILHHVSKFCGLLAPKEGSGGEWSEKKNMSVWCTWLSFDIIGDLAFGKRFNCLEAEENRSIPRATMSANKYMYWFAYLPGARLLAPIMNSKFMELIGGHSVKGYVRLVNYGLEQLKGKIATEEAAKAEGKELRKDMMHYILNAQDPKTGMKLSKAELLAESVLFILAGADTVAISLAASFFYLVHNANTLQKATAEVRSAFQSADEIKNGEALNSCKYLDGVMEETLRRAPPKPSHIPREVLPGDLLIDDNHIPVGTVVGVPAYSIHHHSDYYPDPWSFRPERWLVDEKAGVSQASVDLARRAFCPFSLGVRACIGKNLAYLEYKLALAHILWRFDIRQAEGETLGEGGPDLGEGRQRVDEFQMVDFIAAMKEGPMVEFKAARH